MIGGRQLASDPVRAMVIVGAALAVVAGCSSGATAPAQGGVGVTVEIEAGDNVFRAEKLTVQAGTTVTWTNVGRNNHDVTPVDDDGWGVALAEFGPENSYSRVFTEPGTYRYYCSAHGTKNAGMIGTVVVE